MEEKKDIKVDTKSNVTNNITKNKVDVQKFVSRKLFHINNMSNEAKKKVASERVLRNLK